VWGAGAQVETAGKKANPIHPRTETGDPPIRMLEVLVSGLVGVARTHAGHEHAVVIDQLDLAIRHHHVAILNVAVGDPLALQKARNGTKIAASLLERARIVEMLVEPDPEGIALDPVHPHDRKDALADADPRLLEIEIDEAAVAERAQLLRDRFVLLLDRRDLPMKAAHSGFPARRGDRIGQRKS